MVQNKQTKANVLSIIQKATIYQFFKISTRVYSLIGFLNQEAEQAYASLISRQQQI